MINSNKAVGGSLPRGSFNSNAVARNTQTIDNIKIRNQMRRTNTAMVAGNNDSLSKAVVSSGMGNAVQPIQKNPVVRNRTAKEYHQ